MKFLLILIQLTLIVFNSCAQDKGKIKNDFTKKLLAIRKEKTETSLYEDSNLTMFANKIRTNKLFSVNKDSIRSLMAYNSIYDYNFEIIDLNISDIENISITTLINKNGKLLEVLQNYEFNKIGIDIEHSDRNSKVLILICQNYLSFNKVAYLAAVKPIHPFPSQESGIRIRGEMEIEGIYFYVFSKNFKKENISQLINIKKPLNCRNNYFSIEEKWDSEDVIFFDSNGKIVSYIPVK